ncbi:MAG: polyamine ABC transporter substrate-binding protein [Alphaproteobacteria bacterium]|nr:polyamine ABC transporter substrate-binding protein [Alphaproteobacteria bacterium]
MTMKRFPQSLLASMALFAGLAGSMIAASATGAQDKVVRVYNWSDYIDPKVLEDFTRETGIRVVYDVYDSNDVLETRLMAGRSGYDLVVPTNTYLARQIKAGVLGKLDKSKLPNLRHMDPDLMQRMTKYDPGNEHAVIYMWGTTGIGLNADKIKERMPRPPANSLAMIFDPDVVSKFADCGVNLLDAPDEMIPATLRWLGLDPDSKDPKDLAKAEEHLLKIRPHIRKFHSSQYINDLANGDICLAFGYSGDILQAKARAEEAKNGVRVQYLLPKEGALMWFDNMAIPVDAPNRDNAHALINYLMEPRVIARISDAVQYPNGNKSSLRYISKETMEDEDVFPKPETIRRLYTITPNNQAQQRLLTRIWTRVKAAN